MFSSSNNRNVPQSPSSSTSLLLTSSLTLSSSSSSTSGRSINNTTILPPPRSSLPGGATLTAGSSPSSSSQSSSVAALSLTSLSASSSSSSSHHRTSSIPPRTNLPNLTITPSVTITPTSAPPSGIKPRNVSYCNVFVAAVSAEYQCHPSPPLTPTYSIQMQIEQHSSLTLVHHNLSTTHAYSQQHTEPKLNATNMAYNIYYYSYYCLFSIFTQILPNKICCRYIINFSTYLQQKQMRRRGGGAHTLIL